MPRTLEPGSITSPLHLLGVVVSRAALAGLVCAQSADRIRTHDSPRTPPQGRSTSPGHQPGTRRRARPAMSPPRAERPKRDHAMTDEPQAQEPGQQTTPPAEPAPEPGAPEGGAATAVADDQEKEKAKR